MRDPGRLLEMERELERTFAGDEATLAREPRGWPASLVFFHVAQWRGRLVDALTAFEAGRDYAQPGDIDEINDNELPSGKDLSLIDASARADENLAALMAVIASLGDRAFTWTLTKTTGDAAVRNSYFHPRVHFTQYWRENGDDGRAHELVERTAQELRDLWPSPVILGAGLYNLAAVRVAQGREDEALALLEEAAPMRPDIVELSADDPDLAALKGNRRFEALTGHS